MDAGVIIAIVVELFFCCCCSRGHCPVSRVGVPSSFAARRRKSVTGS